MQTYLLSTTQVQQLQAEMRQLHHSLVVKQDDVTRLNQEGVRLVAELLHAQTNLYNQQTRSRQLEQKLETLQAIEQHAKSVDARLIDKEIQIQTQKEQLEKSTIKEEGLLGQVCELELARGVADAKLAAQQIILAELRTYLIFRDQSVENKIN